MPLTEAAAVAAVGGGLPASYIVCIVIIAVEVIIIAVLISYLLWQPKPQDDMRPPSDVQVNYPGVEEVDVDVLPPGKPGDPTNTIQINYPSGPGIQEDEEDTQDGESELGPGNSEYPDGTRTRDDVGSVSPSIGPSTQRPKSTIVDVGPDPGEIVVEVSDDENRNPKELRKISEDIEKQSTSDEQSSEEQISAEILVSREDIIFHNGWRKTVKLTDVIELNQYVEQPFIDEDTVKLLELGRLEPQEVAENQLKSLLFGEQPIAGILHLDTNERKSIFKAAKDGVIRRGTAISLLEAQAATGNVVDPETGEKLSVSEAAKMGLLDKVYETVLVRAERAVDGYKNRHAEETEVEVLSLFEAMQRGTIVEQHAIRLLEAQIATGGIICPRINMRLPVEIAIIRGLFDEKLLNEVSETKGFFDPNTQENLTYSELMYRGQIDEETGVRLLPFVPQTLHSRGGSRMSLASSIGRHSRTQSVEGKLTTRDGGADVDAVSIGSRGSRASGVSRVSRLSMVSKVSKEGLEVRDIMEEEMQSKQETRSRKHSKVSVKSGKSQSKSRGKSRDRSEVGKSQGRSRASSVGSIPQLENEEVEEMDAKSIKSHKSGKSVGKLTRRETVRIEYNSDGEEVEVGEVEETEGEGLGETGSQSEYTYEEIEEELDDDGNVISVRRVNVDHDLMNPVENEVEDDEEEEITQQEDEIIDEIVVEAVDLQASSRHRIHDLSAVIEEPSHLSDQHVLDEALSSVVILEDGTRGEVTEDQSSVVIEIEHRDRTPGNASRRSHRSQREVDSRSRSMSRENLRTQSRESPKSRRSQSREGLGSRRLSSRHSQRENYFPDQEQSYGGTTEDELDELPAVADVQALSTLRKGPQRSRNDIWFNNGWGREVNLVSLFNSGLITERTVLALEDGRLLEDDVTPLLQRYLTGESPVAGLLLTSTGDKISIYDAAKRGYIRRGTAISLLEAQAATGAVINPRTGERMNVESAKSIGLIDAQYEQVLLRAERAVIGYKSRFSTDTVSVFQAMQRGLIVENHAIRILEAQIATGGIIDPICHHRIPLTVAKEREMFSDRMAELLRDPTDENRGFFDPNTDDNLTYAELLERCVVDQNTGLKLLPYDKGVEPEQLAPTSAKVLFESELRKVTLQDVVEADLIDHHVLARFQSGEMSSHEVKELVNTLKVHVEGSMPIAGVINPATNQKFSIFEAAKNGMIRKGAAFELLEAQAACGKIIDVHAGRVVTLETAARTGVFNREYEVHVERAQRAFEGYKEPFKKDMLSVCEAVQRHLIVERYGIRLLESQVATGGIVDKRSPLRLSIDAAMRKGYIEEQLAIKIKNKTTKSYFDPNTGANLHYAELMEICHRDPDTGFLYLEVDAGTVTNKIQPFEVSKGQAKRTRSISPLKERIAREEIRPVSEEEDETRDRHEMESIGGHETGGNQTEGSVHVSSVKGTMAARTSSSSEKKKKKKKKKALHEIDEMFQKQEVRLEIEEEQHHHEEHSVQQFTQNTSKYGSVTANYVSNVREASFSQKSYSQASVGGVGSVVVENELPVAGVGSYEAKEKKEKKDKKKKKKKEKEPRRSRSQSRENTVSQASAAGGGLMQRQKTRSHVENVVAGYEERVLKEHIEAERMRSPAPTAESVSQHARHRSQSPPKKKDKKQKKDKKKKKKRSRSEDPRGSGSQVLSGTPPLRTQSEERAIDEELAEQYELEQPQHSSPKPSKETFAIKIEDISESEDEHIQVESPVRQPSIVVEDETFKPKKSKKEKKEKKDKKKKKKKTGGSGSGGSDGAAPERSSQPVARPSRPPAMLSRRVVVVDPNSNQELTLEDALKYNLIDEETAIELTKQEGDYAGGN